MAATTAAVSAFGAAVVAGADGIGGVSITIEAGAEAPADGAGAVVTGGAAGVVVAGGAG